MSTEHPARAASHRSMEIVTKKGENAKERWLALFADDAVIEDPIGTSPFDPEGKGHRGRQAIGAFWDMAIAPVELKFDIEKSYACGNEVANVGTITSRTADGMTVAVDGVFTYRVNGEGKLIALRAYWELDKLMASLGAR
jgi:ketosteroid isomerase-like protein